MTVAPPTDVNPQPGQEKAKKTGILGFFDSTAKAITTVTALIVAIGGAWAAIHQFGGSDSGNSEPVTAADHIAACEHSHGMTKAHQKLTLDVGVEGMATCQWPTPPFVDLDGFSAVSTTLGADIPGGTEASGDMLDVFDEQGCAQYRITYNFAKQGDVEHLVPTTVAGGILTNVDKLGTPIKQFATSGEPLATPLDPTEVDVVVTSAVKFYDIQCIG